MATITRITLPDSYAGVEYQIDLNDKVQATSNPIELQLEEGPHNIRIYTDGELTLNKDILVPKSIEEEVQEEIQDLGLITPEAQEEAIAAALETTNGYFDITKIEDGYIYFTVVNKTPTCVNVKFTRTDDTTVIVAVEDLEERYLLGLHKKVEALAGNNRVIDSLDLQLLVPTVNGTTPITYIRIDSMQQDYGYFQLKGLIPNMTYSFMTMHRNGESPYHSVYDCVADTNGEIKIDNPDASNILVIDEDVLLLYKSDLDAIPVDDRTYDGGGGTHYASSAVTSKTIVNFYYMYDTFISIIHEDQPAYPDCPECPECAEPYTEYRIFGEAVSDYSFSDTTFLVDGDVTIDDNGAHLHCPGSGNVNLGLDSMFDAHNVDPSDITGNWLLTFFIENNSGVSMTVASYVYFEVDGAVYKSRGFFIADNTTSMDVEFVLPNVTTDSQKSVRLFLNYYNEDDSARTLDIVGFRMAKLVNKLSL